MAKQQKSQLSNTKSNEEFQLKPCTVNLPITTFSKIRMKCSAYSTETNVILSCHLKQEDTNTFTLRIKRKENDDCVDNNRAKRLKSIEINQVTLGGSLQGIFKHFVFNLVFFLISIKLCSHCRW